MSKIEIYRSPDHKTQVEVRLDKDTVWLSQKQISLLFGTGVPAISKHIKNILADKELSADSTVSKMEIVQTEGRRQVSRTAEVYNLDMIISVGYRVNSMSATQFRQWATQRLKDYLVKGYALNEKRLNEAEERYLDLKRAISLAARAGDTERLSSGEAKGILNVLSQYSFALETLDKYDHQRLTLDIESTSSNRVNKLTYKDAIKQINIWRDNQETGKLFGIERGHSFKSSLDSIYQSIRGKDLYPSIEEKAVNLLYFIVKNHSFTDGNKRIAAGLFVYFLDLNKKLYDESGKKIIGDNALVAITIMIAESSPAERDMMIKLVVNLIINRN
jgi:prophage maintenance system killer protein